MTEPCDLDAVEARRLIGAKMLSPVELLDSCLKRIDAVNPGLNAIVAMDADAARATAEAAEAAVMGGEPLGLLHGLPLGIKDLQATGGLRTTWGSLIYEHHVPDEDEDGIANLRDEGGIVLAKTNTPEFGAGANTKNRVYGATGNPFDPVKTCGGSSGGSAVALATGMVPLATGSDYGGSLRTPAGFCGVVGFRPSPGVVPSPERAVALNPFAVNGSMGRTVRDAHLLLRAMVDVDKRDPYSSDDVMRIPAQLEGVDLASISAAYTADLGTAPVDAGIGKVFGERIGSFKGVFRETENRAPDFENVHEVFEIIRGVNFVAAHRDRLENHRDKLGPNVIDNTERGLKYSAGDVAWAMVEQSKLVRRFHELFEEHDVLIAPAASVSPFPHETLFIGEINGKKLPTYMRWLAITYAPTMALACAAALPCGLDHNGMPFGIQVIGPNGSDALVLEVALSLEAHLASDAATRRPLPRLAAGA